MKLVSHTSVLGDGRAGDSPAVWMSCECITGLAVKQENVTSTQLFISPSPPSAEPGTAFSLRLLYCNDLILRQQHLQHNLSISSHVVAWRLCVCICDHGNTWFHTGKCLFATWAWRPSPMVNIFHSWHTWSRYYWHELTWGMLQICIALQIHGS